MVALPATGRGMILPLWDQGLIPAAQRACKDGAALLPPRHARATPVHREGLTARVSREQLAGDRTGADAAVDSHAVAQCPAGSCGFGIELHSCPGFCMAAH